MATGGIVEIAEAILGLGSDIDGEGFAVLHAPFERFEIGVVPITAVGIAETIAVVGGAPRQLDHSAGTIIIVHIDNGCAGLTAWQKSGIFKNRTLQNNRILFLSTQDDVSQAFLGMSSLGILGCILGNIDSCSGN